LSPPYGYVKILAMKALCCVLAVICCGGCFSHAPVKPSPAIPLEITGEDFDVPKLKAGGRLALAGFRAGPQAESNDLLDQISVMLQKGIQEKLKSSAVALQLTEQAADADFVLAGYVEEFYSPGRLSRLVMRKRASRLAVSGQIYLKTGGDKLLTFAASRTIKNKDKPLDRAYQMGLMIGDYILEHVGKGAS
jgi:hypothetical protein